MYLACRHVKPDGVRCKSPALKGTPFCYFHTKLHIPVSANDSKVGALTLPLVEDAAAIQLALSRILDGLLTARIDPKLAGHLLYGIQIASQNVTRISNWSNSVEAITHTKEGDDLAPEARICNGYDVCVGCKFADECPSFDSENDGKDDDDDD